ncbi:MAG: hypothetical protein ABIA93_04420 [Candidatus Woesearchaeota archaeon]
MTVSGLDILDKIGERLGAGATSYVQFDLDPRDSQNKVAYSTFAENGVRLRFKAPFVPFSWQLPDGTTDSINHVTGWALDNGVMLTGIPAWYTMVPDRRISWEDSECVAQAVPDFLDRAFGKDSGTSQMDQNALHSLLQEPVILYRNGRGSGDFLVPEARAKDMLRGLEREVRWPVNGKFPLYSVEIHAGSPERLFVGVSFPNIPNDYVERGFKLDALKPDSIQVTLPEMRTAGHSGAFAQAENHLRIVDAMLNGSIEEAFRGEQEAIAELREQYLAVAAKR